MWKWVFTFKWCLDVRTYQVHDAYYFFLFGCCLDKWYDVGFSRTIKAIFYGHSPVSLGLKFNGVMRDPYKQFNKFIKLVYGHMNRVLVVKSPHNIVHKQIRASIENRCMQIVWSDRHSKALHIIYSYKSWSWPVSSFKEVSQRFLLLHILF